MQQQQAQSSYDAFGKAFALHRYPHHSRSELRAWDSGDQYLLELAEPLITPETSICVIHDNFGALTTPLIDREVSVVSYGDSWMSREAILHNLELNGISRASLNFVSDTSKLHSNNHPPNLIIGRVPKNKSQLAYILHELHNYVEAGCILLLGGMDKHLSKGQFDLLERYFGPTFFHPGKKKARVWQAQVDKELSKPKIKFGQYHSTHPKLELAALPNVFSATSLDIGARLFLEQLDKLPEKQRVADLACGNGVLGISYLSLHPESHILFTDESFQASHSTKINLEKNHPEANTKVQTGDGLKCLSSESLELILCNPPFHQQNTLSKEIALSLFKDARRTLEKDGELWIVANRHLGYHTALKKLFGNCAVEASNSKFVILKALKR